MERIIAAVHQFLNLCRDISVRIAEALISRHRSEHLQIIIPAQTRDMLRDHARRQSPNESCAMLFGRNNTVSDVFLARNIKESPVRFEISAEETLDGYEAARKRGTEVIGIFHSHPRSEAYPSETDATYMEINPVTWVIYSGTEDHFRAYRLEPGVIEVAVSGS